MKKRIALIGLGNLSPKLSPALSNNRGVDVIAICDKNENAIGRRMYGDVPFYTDYRQILACKPDYVYIATNPEAHFEPARFFLEHNIRVLCDKPPTMTLDEYRNLKQLAHEKDVYYNVIYHFCYSREILWLKEHIGQFGRLIYANARFDDPYCENGVILPGRELLRGAWVDSASNILGVWAFLFDELTLDCQNMTTETDAAHGLPIRVMAQLSWEKIPFSIAISWKNHTRNKEMIFVFEKATIYIDFPNQEVYVNGKLVLKNYDEQSTVVHYTNFFNEFEAFSREKKNGKVIELLYTINKADKT